MQAWPLERKIQVTQAKILEWYYHYDGKVAVSFSGGKDSLVALDLARRAFPDIPATGEHRTGCMFCMFGIHLEKGTNRFQRMALTHPKQHDFCVSKLGCGRVLDYINVPYAPYETQDTAA